MEILSSLVEFSLDVETAFENALPVLLLLLSLMTLTGNFAVTTLFDQSGLGLTGRTICGLGLGAAGLLLAAGLIPSYATIAVIAMASLLAVSAFLRGANQVARINIATAAMLVTVVVIP